MVHPSGWSQVEQSVWHAWTRRAWARPASAWADPARAAHAATEWAERLDGVATTGQTWSGSMHDVSAYHLRGMCAGLTGLGLDVMSLLAEANLDPQLLADTEARIPEAQALALFLAAQRRHGGHEHFGLLLAQHVPPGKLELVDYLIAASPTVGAAIEALAHHAALCASGLQYRLKPGERDGQPGTYVSCVHAFDLATLPSSTVDYLWLLLVSRMRAACGPAFQPHLQLRRVLPTERARYLALAGAVPGVGEREQMFLPRAQWELANPRWDPMLRQLLEAHARDVTARLPGPDFVARARHAVADGLRMGQAGIDAAAQRLGTSPRSLQRRLQDAGLGYQDLLDDVRKELVLRLMTGSQLSLKEIADLAGYADASTFGRAFRRWTAHTPAQYRRIHGPS